MKYYFIAFSYGTWDNSRGRYDWKPGNEAIDRHPGEFQMEANKYAKDTGRRTLTILTHWQEITLEEFVYLQDQLDHA